MNIGSVIRDIRKRKKITQTQLAKMSKITQTYLSQIENNQKSPTLQTITSIAENLSIPIPVLLFLAMEQEDISSPQQEIYKTLAPSLKSLLNNFITK